MTNQNNQVFHVCWSLRMLEHCTSYIKTVSILLTMILSSYQVPAWNFLVQLKSFWDSTNVYSEYPKIIGCNCDFCATFVHLHTQNLKTKSQPI